MILIKDAALKYKIDRSTLAKYCRNNQVTAKKLKITTDAKTFMGNKNQLLLREAWFIDENSLIDLLSNHSKNDSNSYQVGGEHYKKFQYQPWDFIMDYDIPFALGLAIKYVIRHREKNGKNDLEKAIHCIKKAQERNLDRNCIVKETDFYYKPQKFIMFFDQFGLFESRIIKEICKYKFNDAIKTIGFLIDSEYSKS